MRNGRNEQHNIITDQEYQLNGPVNHGRNYLGNHIPNTNKGIKKPSKIMTDGKRVNAYSGVDKSSRKKEFGRRKWGEVTIKDSKIIL